MSSFSNPRPDRRERHNEVIKKTEAGCIKNCKIKNMYFINQHVKEESIFIRNITNPQPLHKNTKNQFITKNFFTCSFSESLTGFL
jgi:hypothetical protein